MARSRHVKPYPDALVQQLRELGFTVDPITVSAVYHLSRHGKIKVQARTLPELVPLCQAVWTGLHE